MPWMNSFSSYGKNMHLFIASVLIPAYFIPLPFEPLLPYHPSYLTSQNVSFSILSWIKSWLAPLIIHSLPWGSDTIFPACRTDFSQLLVACLTDYVYTVKGKGARDSLTTRELLQQAKTSSAKTRSEKFWASWGLSSQYKHYCLLLEM